MRKAGPLRLTFLSVVRDSLGELDDRHRGTPRRHRAVRRPRRLHLARRAPRPGSGHPPRRVVLPAAWWPRSRRSAAVSTRSSATPSSPSSGLRSPTRTTPTAPCAPPCGCRRRSPVSSPNARLRRTSVDDADPVDDIQHAHRDQHRRGPRRHGRRIRLHGDGRRRQHGVAPPIARPAWQRADRRSDRGVVLAGHHPRAVRHHADPWPPAGRTAVDRHWSHRCRRPPGALRHPIRRPHRRAGAARVDHLPRAHRTQRCGVDRRRTGLRQVTPRRPHRHQARRRGDRPRDGLLALRRDEPVVAAAQRAGDAARPRARRRSRRRSRQPSSSVPKSCGR